MASRVFSTFVETIRWWAGEQPDQFACTYLVDGEREAVNLTYAGLDRRARAIAAWLQERDAAGERVILLFPPGLDYLAAFFGCLYAGAIAVPAYPPHRRRHDSRLEAIVRDAQATIILSTQAIRADAQQQLSHTPGRPALQWFAAEEIDEERADLWREPGVSAETIAFLQYTSGSTAAPKGVMVSHGNILYNERMVERAYEHVKPIFVSWLPVYHDMGLVGNIMQPLYLGSHVTFMSPVAFLQEPYRWLRAISDCRAVTSGGPNFGYDLCVDKITQAQRETLDLSSWSSAYNGAEPIRHATLERFADAFAPCGLRREALYPCYGLAEGSLFVAGGFKNALPIVKQVDRVALASHRVLFTSPTDEHAQTLVSSGRSWLDQKIVIVDPETRTRCLPEQVGEIWVSGPNVAQGYWNRPDESAAAFQAYLADTGEGPFLRTGDLGFLNGEDLFVTGRIKDVIILRGRNYYPQDIELTVERSHVAIRAGCVAAFSVDIADTEQLVIVAEIEREHLRGLDVEAVVAEVRRAINEEYQLAVYAIQLIKTLQIPKTSSGKIQRRACRTAFLNGSFEVVGTWQAASAETDDAGDTRNLQTAQAAPMPGLHNGLYGPLSTQRARFIHQNGLPTPPTPSTSQTQADAVIGWLRRYANERINSSLIDERRTIPPYVVLDLGNRGLLGMQAPIKYGGLGLGHADTMRVIEQIGAIDQTLSLFVGLNNILGIRPILNYGSQPVREELLPILATGRELGAFSLTEPGAGSNPRQVVARATPQGRGWRLDGTKIWSGSAAWAGVLNVFVQHLDADGHARGISGFVVRQGAPGLRQGPEALTMGMRGMVQNTVYLEGVAVGPEHLLGEAGAGIEVAQDAMMYGRLAIAAASLGGMKRCAMLMLGYAEQRTVSTGRLLHNPVTLARLGELNAMIATLGSLVSLVTRLLDRGVYVPVEAYTACKIAGPEFFWIAVDWLMQLLGGRGYIEPNIAPQFLRDARVLRIFEGPTETLTMFLGSRTVNQAEELDSFLRRELGATALADRLREAAAQVYHRCTSHRAPFTDAAATQWAYTHIGEVTTYALLLAAVQQEQRSSEGMSSHSIDWAQAQFEQKIALALAGAPAEQAIAEAEIIAAHIGGYRDAIGDLQQTLAGADFERDPLIRNPASQTVTTLLTNGAAAPIPEARPTPARPAANGAAQYTTETIAHWITSWLIRELKLAAHSVDSSTAFADYGLDSVKAVELAHELQLWLGNRLDLDATIAWNFPTINALARHLADELSGKATASAGERSGSAQAADVDSLAGADFAELLKEELEAVKRRRSI